MRVMEDTAPEWAIFCNQARQVVGLRHQPSHKTLRPTTCPDYKIHSDKDGTEIEGKANQCLVQFETHNMRGSLPLKPFMIF